MTSRAGIGKMSRRPLRTNEWLTRHSKIRRHNVVAST